MSTPPQATVSCDVCLHVLHLLEVAMTTPSFSEEAMPTLPIQGGELPTSPQVSVACRRASRLSFLKERATPTLLLQLQDRAKPPPSLQFQ